MSDILVAPPPLSPQAGPAGSGRQPKQRRTWIRIFLVCVAIAAAGAMVLSGFRTFQRWSARSSDDIAVAEVVKGDVSFTISAKGELRGGHPETLIGPMTGGNELHLTYLAKNGQAVNPSGVIAKFDTSEQEYKLKEALADVAEAEQKIVQAKANRDAQKEEDEYALIKAKNDFRLAELEVRKNPLLAAITAKQNDLALASAREHLRQVDQNLSNRAETNGAGIAKEEAGREKAASQAKTAQENIDAMTLRAQHSGYVSIKQNMNQNMMFGGMGLPLLQVGDTVRPGMMIAEIPDLHSWEVGAAVGEVDRGHIKVGDAATIHIIAVPGRTFKGHIQDLGGSTGNFWERHFECKVALDEISPELRPGMSTELLIATDTMRGALSIPAQALFDTNGTSYVFVRSGNTFMRKDVQLIRKNETRAVISGLRQSQLVALSNPLDQPQKKKDDAASPIKAASQ